MNRIKLTLAKHKDVILYLVFGVLTTVVNYIVYFPVHNLLKFSAAVSNVIAWIIAVIFAFFTNKPFVFKSNDWSKEVMIPEALKFVGCRISSGIIETLILLLFVDILSVNGNSMKIVTSVVVVILNYFGSKLLVFRKKQ